MQEFIPSESYSLNQILLNILNKDLVARKQAESKINYLLTQNFSSFLLEISKKLSDELELKELRQLSAILIKNIINNPSYINQYLYGISLEIKEKIKKNILSTLASPLIDIRKAAALATSSICKIEIPLGQWLNIFEIMISTSQNDNIYIQLSSLTALEYIFEEINKKDISNNLVAKLLNNYYFLLNNDSNKEELLIATLKSVNKFLPFINNFMKEKSSSIKFFDLIKKNIMNENDKVRAEAIKVFIDICRLYYDSLDFYIDQIFNLSKKIIDNDIEGNKILCLNLWFFIGKEEDYRINCLKKDIGKKPNYYLQKYYDELSNLCIKYLIVDKYEDIDEENSVSFCSYQLIYIMSLTCQFNYIQKLLKYIKLNINNNLEKIRYSALNVFRAIIGNIHKKYFYNIIKDSLSMISDILLENMYSFSFKILSAKIMKNITKEYADKFINDIIYFNNLITLFLSLIKISTKEIIYIMLICLNNLCIKIEWDENKQSNILSKNMQSICEPLLKIIADLSYYDTQNNIIRISFLLLGNLAQRSALDVKDYMINVFKYLIRLYESSLDIHKTKNIDIILRYQEYALNCINNFLITKKVDKYLMNELLSFVLKSFIIRDLYDEGIILIGFIASFEQDEFKNIINIISPYLIQGLKRTNCPSLCKSSILCLSNIINSVSIDNEFINDFFPLIKNILSDNEIDRNLKPLSFNIISDLYLYFPFESFYFLDDVMKILGSAIQATQIKFDENNDEDNIQFFIDLREHILESLNCIFHCIKTNNKKKEFIPYIYCIVNYINFISNDFANSIDIIQNSLYLLASFCEEYNNEIKSLLDMENIKLMIKKIEINKQKDEERLKWAKNAIGRIF